MNDPVHAELDARVDAALENGDGNARELVARLILWENVTGALLHLNDTLEAMRRIRTHKRIFRRVHKLLDVPILPWWTCGRRPRRIYDDFSNGDLLDALAQAVLEK